MKKGGMSLRPYPTVTTGMVVFVPENAVQQAAANETIETP
jgi:hypothetical protein